MKGIVSQLSLIRDEKKDKYDGFNVDVREDIIALNEAIEIIEDLNKYKRRFTLVGVTAIAVAIITLLVVL